MAPQAAVRAEEVLVAVSTLQKLLLNVSAFRIQNVAAVCDLRHGTRVEKLGKKK
jgi:hypothetical protein